MYAINRAWGGQQNAAEALVSAAVSGTDRTEVARHTSTTPAVHAGHSCVAAMSFRGSSYRAVTSLVLTSIGSAVNQPVVAPARGCARGSARLAALLWLPEPVWIGLPRLKLMRRATSLV